QGFASISNPPQTTATARYYLAKVGVEGSNPFARSRFSKVAKFDESPLCQRAFRCPGDRLRQKAIRAARRRFSLPPDVLTLFWSDPPPDPSSSLETFQNK